MKAIQKTTQRLYWKNSVTDWNQPLIWDNGSFWGDRFAVYRYNEGGGYRGGDAWEAFCTYPNWGGHWTGNYGDEYSTALNLVMYTPVPTLVTGYSVYIPTVDSAMDWGSCRETGFYGSNDGASWVNLNWTWQIAQDRQLTFTFNNSTYYRTYRFYYRTHGSGHKDYIAICSFKLIAKYKAVTQGTATDYDYYEDVPAYQLGYRENKYYGLG